MPKPPTQRFWFAFSALRAWSWSERGIVLALLLLSIVGTTLSPWLGVALWLTAMVAVQVVIHRHGGWRLLGPHFYYDVIRLARRGRSTILRIAYIFAMFTGLAYVYETADVQRTWSHNDFAQVSERFAFALFTVQNLAVMLLTPAYLASAVAEEKERRTLELLFTTQLSDTEIILGKLFSRLIHLFGFVLAGFPILSVVQMWGGIDLLLIAGNLANTFLNILSVGSICLLASVLSRTVTTAVMTSYAIILPTSFCCMAALRGFPFVLQDARQGAERMISVQDVWILAIPHLTVSVLCVVLAVMALREHEIFDVTTMPPLPRPPDPDLAVPAMLSELSAVLATEAPAAEPKRRKHRVDAETADLFAVPYTLPPVTDQPLLWKERYVGGPPLFFSPIILVPLLPLLVTGVLIMEFWYFRALFLERQEYQRTVEVWAGVHRFFYYVFLGCYLLGVAYRCTASVARERQQQTLEPLLLLPIERRDILWAKLLGSLWRGWPWLGLLLGNIVMGTLVGAYHPFSAVLLCLAPWPLIAFFAAAGMLLSVSMRTVLRANLVLVVGMIAAFYLLVSVSFATQRSFIYLEVFAFSAWQYENRQPSDIVFAFFIMLLLLGMALIFGTAALKIFENRARHADR